MTGTKSSQRRRQTTANVVSPSDQYGSDIVGAEGHAVTSNDGHRRSSRGKRSLPSQHPVDQEQESARALMQLAQGSLSQVDAPQVVPGPQLLHVNQAPVRPSEGVGNHRVISRRHANDSKRLRKKNENNEFRRALAEEQLLGTEPPDSGEPSTPIAQRDDSPVHDSLGIRRGSLHPLDDIPTDDEVDEFTQGTREVSLERAHSQEHSESGQVDPRGKAFYIRHHTPPISSYNDDERIILPHDLASASSKDGPKRRKNRKKKIDTEAALRHEQFPTEERSPPSLFIDQRKSQSPTESNKEKNAYPNPSTSGFGTTMPIDPNLDNTTPGPFNVTETSASSANDSHSLTNQSSGLKKRKRQGQLEHNNENSKFEEEDKPYFSPYQDPAAPTTPDGSRQLEETSNRPQTSRKKGKNGLLVSALHNAQGRFGQPEIETIERYRQKWCQRNYRQISDFNALVQSPIRGQPEALSIFKEIQEMFPSQSPSYVQRFCRRKFHNFAARGTWTPEADDHLRQVVAEKGTSWKAVGEAMDRFPEDCRDRWRNYLVNMENRNHEQWTDAEILNLAAAILDCARTKAAELQKHEFEQQLNEASGSPPNLDLTNLDMKLVNWQSVSDRMGSHGGGRSRLQCSFKWNKIKAADQINFLEQAQSFQQLSYDSVDNTNSENLTMSKGWRASLARKKVSNMLTGDKIDLLRGILTSGAISEGHIPWKAIGPPWFQKTWNVAEKKAAWVLLKESYPFGKEDDYRPVAEYLLNAQPAEEANDHWDPSPWEDERARQRALNPQRGGYRPRRRQRSPTPNNSLLEQAEQDALISQSGDDLPPADDPIDLTGEPDDESATQSRRTKRRRKSGNHVPEVMPSIEDENVGPELASQIMSLRSATSN